jgi:hypothetical protein
MAKAKIDNKTNKFENLLTAAAEIGSNQKFNCFLNLLLWLQDHLSVHNYRYGVVTASSQSSSSEELWQLYYCV